VFESGDDSIFACRRNMENDQKIIQILNDTNRHRSASVNHRTVNG